MSDSIKETIRKATELQFDGVCLMKLDDLYKLQEILHNMVSELSHLDIDDATSSEEHLAKHLIRLGYMEKSRCGNEEHMWEEFVGTN